MSDLNPITRREVFLAAAGGQQVETPEPITREEKFLKAIAENAGGGSDLPDDPAQDGTYNLQNTVSSGTGTLSWASGGSSGGGVLVVHDVDGTLDKTAAEILAAYENNTVVVKMAGEDDGTPYIDAGVIVDAHVVGNDYSFGVFMGNYTMYTASSGTDYPTLQA